MLADVGGLSLLIDHVAFATASVERASGELDRLGLPHTAIGVVSWPGPDGPIEARSVSSVLADGYLDIIELAEGGATALTPTGVMLASDAVDDTRRLLMAAGVRCAHPYRITRSFDDRPPDHTYDVFGIDTVHRSGLAMAVVQTSQERPLLNTTPGHDEPGTLRVAASAVGVELG